MRFGCVNNQISKVRFCLHPRTLRSTRKNSLNSSSCCSWCCLRCRCCTCYDKCRQYYCWEHFQIYSSKMRFYSSLRLPVLLLGIGPARRFAYISGSSPAIIPLQERPEPFTVKLSPVTERRSQDSDCTHFSRAGGFRQKKEKTRTHDGPCLPRRDCDHGIGGC